VKLAGKVAIVTGSSRGIGKAIALALAQEGADVVVAARTEVEQTLPGTIYKTAAEIQALGRRALPLKVNVTQEQEVAQMVTETLAEFGRIDILVNNAGVSAPGSMLELSVKRWDLIMAVNVRSTFLCTKAVLPYMIEQRRGNIINLSSILGTKVIEGNIAYGSAKAAIERFTLGLAKELEEYNIAVNALRPGYTVTEGIKFLNPEVDTSRWQIPQMWGRYAAFLATREAKDLTGRLLTAEELEQECAKWDS
jgi:citronellol/citronellal dehydrogenase